MSEDLNNSTQQVRSRIDIHEESQVRYWMKELGVDERTLKATVAAVGYSADAVRERLKQRARLN